MNTVINLNYNGVPYKLEYDRMSVKVLEANGLNINDFLAKPYSNIELVFAGAFVKNHRKTKQSVIDAIFASCPNKDDLLNALITMISETYESLFSEPEGEEGNVEWEVVDLTPKKVQK